MQQGVGEGGFFFPKVYRESKAKVLELLQQGQMELIETSRWTLADEFMAFILQTKFLEFADHTYPTPREKTEVPIWFLVSCQLVMKIHLQKSYVALGALLRAGPVLSRVGFNVLAALGFNDKNRKDRVTPVHHDSVRKFFKDTDAAAMRRWYSTDMQRWFEQMGCVDKEGVYILDQTHVVVPPNAHYEDAVYMAVDEHGQRYKGYDDMTEEQRKGVRHHPCYTLSTLLHLSFKKQAFHIAGYEWGPGNEDELPQAQKIVKTFFEHHPHGSMKLLIVDRGYVDGKFIARLKKRDHVDVLCPLRRNMHQYTDAIALSQMDDAHWVNIEAPRCTANAKSCITRACTIDNINLWDECDVPLYTTVVEVEERTEDDLGFELRHFVLCSTRKFDSPHAVIDSYRLRTSVEECFRQFKIAWRIGDFPSPHRSLLEAHVGFTLLTYSLLQLYLMREDLQKKTRSHITQLKREEHNLDQPVVVFAGDYFGQFENKDLWKLALDLPKEVQQKLRQSIDDSPHQF